MYKDPKLLKRNAMAGEKLNQREQFFGLCDVHKKNKTVYSVIINVFIRPRLACKVSIPVQDNEIEPCKRAFSHSTQTGLLAI